MKHSYKLSDAIHILTYVDIYKNDHLSRSIISASIDANTSVMNNFLSKLKKAGLLNNQPGVARASLAKPASEISVLDVYRAITSTASLLHVDPKTNPNCVVGANIQNRLEEVYQRVQNAAELEMSQISIQDVIDGVLESERLKQKAGGDGEKLD